MHADTFCLHADTYCMHAEAYCMHAGGYCMHADTHCRLHTEINYRIYPCIMHPYFGLHFENKKKEAENRGSGYERIA